MLQPPDRFTCSEYRGRLEGATRPLLVQAFDDEGTSNSFVMKLRRPDGPRAHPGPVALACELICAVLARGLNLSVPDYAILSVTEAFIGSVPDDRVKELLRTNIGDNFGTVYRLGCPEWQHTSREPSPDFLVCLEDVLTFDAIMMNVDRQIVNPNLLYRGDDWFLIDHSRAILPLCERGPAAPALSSESEGSAGDVVGGAGQGPAARLFSRVDIRAHCAYLALRGQHRDYTRLMGHWRERVTLSELARLRSWVPDDWETTEGELDRLFEALEHRPEHFEAIQRSLQENVR